MSKPICGIVMPISAIEDCDAQHWIDVKEIISDAVREAGYEPQLVSTAIEVNIIQTRIVQNLYQNPIVICDVSCKNANVMFELGLRLAFDKPTIVIKDDQTGYSFDTSLLEHLTYPRSLRHGTINKFKEELVVKIKGTIDAKDKDPNFSPFLKSFGPIKAASMETREVPAQEIVLDTLQAMMLKLDRLQSPNVSQRSISDYYRTEPRMVLGVANRFDTGKLSKSKVAIITNMIHSLDSRISTTYVEDGSSGAIRVKGPELTPDKLTVISNFIAEVTERPRPSEE